MIDSVFSILGLDPANLIIPDSAVLCIVGLVFLYILDWVFRLLYLVIATLTKRR